MRQLANLIVRTGDFLISLSDRTKKAIVLCALLLLGGGGIYKLVLSLRRLKQPIPVATPEQLTGPMEDMVRQTTEHVDLYRQTRRTDASQLDSLSKVYNDPKNRDHADRPFRKSL